jgi:uncharacterized membrane protein (UPF0182 family)
MNKANRSTFVLIGIFLVLWISTGPAIGLVVDGLWFDSLGYWNIFATSVGTQVVVWAVAFVTTVLFVGFNARIAWKDAPWNFAWLAGTSGELQLTASQLRKMAGGGIAIGVLLVSMMFARSASSLWLEILSYADREDFGRVEPIFGRDIGFYVFELPLWEHAQQLLFFLTLVGLAVVAAIHLGRERLRQGPLAIAGGAGGQVLTIDKGNGGLEAHFGPLRRQGFSDGARAHLLNLGGVLFLLFALDFWLQRFELLMRHSGGVVFGAGYADVHAQIPAFWIMIAVSIGVTVALVASVFRQDLKVAVGGLVGFFLMSVLANGLYPAMVQKFIVTPNELSVEREYLEYNIKATREAYALDRIEVRPFEASPDLTLAGLDRNPLTVKNIRIWDDQPLGTTYGQLQEIRLYYDFQDVDIDRYIINGELRQVMLSARELNYSLVSATARSWVNEHLQYTHGYGVTMSPVNVVTGEGLPELWIQDIPPVSSVGFEVNRPEIYYGELTDQYVLVRTSAEEFDYPVGDTNAYTRYAGDGGVQIGALWKKLAFAAYHGSLDMVLSNYLGDETRILMRRNIRKRVHTLVPFLDVDGDPYLVLSEGRMFWILDAYTTSDRYPYSETVGGGSFNYLRNSVKIVVDAYHGSVQFYVADADDPLIRVYGRIFDQVFQPIEQMSADLREHVRYPVDFFNVQAGKYMAHHMKDPTVFYNKEDMWTLPKELYDGQNRPMQSYYLIMKLPQEDSAEFVLLVPFSPSNKDNMISWLAARSDGDDYGKLILYQFPKQKLIFGPRQVESRIDQNPEISQQLTLWNQGGSRVVRGNLLVIPIEDSLMYVEPLYLQAESSELPELKRVIVSYENRIAMETTLEKALAVVFGVASPTPSFAIGPTTPTPFATFDGDVRGDWQSLALQAQRSLQDAETAQRAGDWAGYGQALEALRAYLGALGGQAAPPDPEEPDPEEQDPEEQ